MSINLENMKLHFKKAMIGFRNGNIVFFIFFITSLLINILLPLKEQELFVYLRLDYYFILLTQPLIIIIYIIIILVFVIISYKSKGN